MKFPSSLIGFLLLFSTLFSGAALAADGDSHSGQVMDFPTRFKDTDEDVPDHELIGYTYLGGPEY